MSFGIIILIRILFAACMVFVIGYIFGNFSKKPALATMAKIASIPALVLFISSNIWSYRVAHWQHNVKNSCTYYQKDTTETSNKISNNGILFFWHSITG